MILLLGVLSTMLGLSRSTTIALALLFLAVLVWRKWDSIRQIYYLAKLPHPGLPWYLGGVLLPMICRRKRPLTSPEIVMPITLDWAKAHGGDGGIPGKPAVKAGGSESRLAMNAWHGMPQCRLVRRLMPRPRPGSSPTDKRWRRSGPPRPKRPDEWTPAPRPQWG